VAVVDIDTDGGSATVDHIVDGGGTAEFIETDVSDE
jgi:hypothetical protein